MPREATQFSKANPRPGPGRKKMTDEEKRKARIQRAADYDFKEECRALLPLATDQILDDLVKKKFKPAETVRAVEALRDSIYGKPPQAITGAGGGPLAFSFAQLVASVDGGKTQKI